MAGPARGCAGLLAGLLLLGAGAPSPGVDLTVENLRNERGMLRFCVTANRSHFPDCRGDPAARTLSIPASERRAGFDLPPGEYALSLVHDENGNGRLDTTLGIPREGFAFSRNPPIRFGPPRYEEANVVVGEDRTSLTVRVRYLL